MLPDYILSHHQPPTAPLLTLTINARGYAYPSKALLSKLDLRSGQPMDLLPPSADCPSWQLDLRPTAAPHRLVRRCHSPHPWPQATSWPRAAWHTAYPSPSAYAVYRAGLLPLAPAIRAVYPFLILLRYVHLRHYPTSPPTTYPFG
jgi:hypothetical protein